MNTTSIGIVMLAAYLLSQRFLTIPALFQGILLGLSLFFILMGMLSENSLVKLKRWKRSFLGSFKPSGK